VKYKRAAYLPKHQHDHADQRTDAGSSYEPYRRTNRGPDAVLCAAADGGQFKSCIYENGEVVGTCPSPDRPAKDPNYLRLAI
jgi:hypothetical protein